jgi:hypothetical protein
MQGPVLAVGLGQVLGRAFDAYPNRIMGYTLNIGGSLVGIVTFSFISFVQAPPPVWFFVICAGIGYLLHQVGGLARVRWLTLVALVVVVTLPGPTNRVLQGSESFWSRYYAVRYDPANLAIFVNNSGHQQMQPFETGGAEYSLVHLLQRGAGGAPFRDVLIIGAGSGNDIDHALRYGVGRIDAVEIDPVIQRIGIRSNPDRPYADPRVIRHLDDGRHYVRTTDRQIRSGYLCARRFNQLVNFTDQGVRVLVLSEIPADRTSRRLLIRSDSAALIFEAGRP